MKKLSILLAALLLLLISFVGCSSDNNTVGSDTNDQIQANDAAQKSADRTDGDPDDIIEGNRNH